MDPKLIGRQSELSDLRRAIARQGGAVVIGSAGVGKTFLAREAVNSSAHRWVAATAEAATIPYGPLVAALPAVSRDLAQGAEAQAVRIELEGVETLVVDDAHLLDAASASLIHHLAVEGAVAVLATVRAGEVVPESVTALWKDVGLLRLDLGPLGRELTTELTEELLGGPADPHFLDTIWERSRGGPLEIRELILSARELGLLEFVDGQWVITGELTPTPRLSDLVEARLSRLNDAEREAADLLAYSEGSGIGLVLEIADRTALDNLERSGIASHRTDGASGYVVELAHPLYGEVLRSRLPAGRRAELAALLTRSAETVGGTIDPLRLGTWRFDAGLADAEELAATGRIAYGREAYALALRLGQASLAQEESYQAHIVVGASLAEYGRLGEAEPHFRRAQEVAPDRLRGAWALYGYAWYLFAERPDDALELVRKEIASEDNPEVVHDLTAGLALLLALYGSFSTTTAMTSKVLDGELVSDQARLLALVARSLTDVAALRPADAIAAANTAWGAVDRVRSALPNADDLLNASLTEADLIDCRPDEAFRRVDRRLDQLSSQVDKGFWHHMTGRLQLWEADATASYNSQRSAIRLLEQSDPGFTLPLAIAEAAHAASVLGRQERALTLLGSIDPETPRVRLAAGYVFALVGATTESIDQSALSAVEIGDEAADLGNTLQAARSWHLAVRLGRPELVVGRLEECASETEAPLVRLLADHGKCLADGDVSGLKEVGRRLGEARLGLFAAEVFAQASELHMSTQEQSRARYCSAVAREYVAGSTHVHTPAMEGLVDGTILSERERGVALLAASGLPSRDIAEQLFVSVRTVDNHLGSVYAKVGVSSREELAGVFAVRQQGYREPT